MHISVILCIWLRFFWVIRSVLVDKIDETSVGQLRGGGESIVTVLKQLCFFKLFAETLNDDHINAGK